MSDIKWDAALVIRANELLVEVRRYHSDAEATRLQLASAAATMARKIDDLPAMVKELVEVSLQQDSLKTELPVIAKRIDLSTRMLEQLSDKLRDSGISFIRHVRRISGFVVITGLAVGIATVFWATRNSTEALRLSAEVATLQKTVNQFQQTGSQPIIKSCTDGSLRPRLCVRIDESIPKSKDSYYLLAR